MGQMAWLDGFNSNGTKILHLREDVGQPWKPYTSSRHRVPDLQIPGASKGWTTYQKLFKAGWTLIPTEDAHNAQPPAPICDDDFCPMPTQKSSDSSELRTQIFQGYYPSTIANPSAIAISGDTSLD